MSKQVDERIVSMQFDNKHFETNVKTTMSSLDKLKAKLSFKNESKGLENIDKAAKKTDLSPLAKSAETVRVKFSAMEVMGVTALANITNSAVNAGKKIASALTIDPITSGFKEYETQINATQTILANTQSKGSTIDDVNRALEELNKYADMTIYNFTEMTRNIGTFTAAGVDLDTSTNAIKGIANLAAMSGSTSQQASTAMYQLSQALASGTVKLMDWNSVVNAGMGGQVFQDALKQTARNHGIAIDSMIKKEGSFRETLKDGWLTADVLTETLNHFTLAAEEGTEQWNEYKKSLMDQGYTEKEALEILQLSNTATDAATKVKTFTQLWDVLKESAQSGWAQTWKLIIGDFEQAKALLSPLADFLTGALNGISNIRNTIVSAAMGSPFAKFAEKIASVGAVTEKVAQKLLDYEDVVNRIIKGEYGNGRSRWDKLTEEGYDWAHAQNLVNERLGDSTRHATNYTEVTGELTEQVKELSDEELRNLGFTEEEIRLYRELEKQARETGVSITELLERMSQKDGRTMLWEGLGNIGKSIAAVFGSIKNAWLEIFPPENLGLKLYNLIAGFYDLSKKLVLSDDSADKLKRTFKGVFAVLDILLTIVGGPIKIAFKIFSQLLGAFDLNILDVTAGIGDAIVAFRDWFDSVLDFTKIFEKLVPYIKSFIEIVKRFGSNIKESFGKIAPDIIAGLKNGLINGFKNIGAVISNLANFLITKFKEILGIHSPSTVFMAIGGFIVAGLVAGLVSGEIDIFSTLSGIGSCMIEEAKKWLPGLAGVITNLIDNIKGYILNIDFGTILSSALIGGFVFTLYKLTGIIGKFAAPVEAMGDVLESASKFLDNFGKGLKSVLKGKSLEYKSEALLNLAKSIGILAIAIIVLGKTDPDVLIQGGIALAALAGGLVVLGLAARLVGSGKGITKMAGTLIGMSVAILIVTAALKNLSFLTPENIDPIMEAMWSIVGLMGVTMLISKIPVSSKGLASTLLSVSVSLLIMAKVVKTLGTMDPKVMAVGTEAVIQFLVFVGMLMAASKIPGSSSGLGGLFFGVAASLLAMTSCIKILGTMEPDVIKQGAGAITMFVGLIAALLVVNKLIGSSESKGMAGLFFGVGVALLAMATTVKILGTMKQEVIEQGVKAILAFGAVIAVLLLVSRNSQVKGLMGTLLAASVAIGILAGVCVVLGLVSEDKLKQGVIAVTVLGSLMAVLIYVAKNAKGAMSGIVAITVAIAVIVASVAALSFIKGTELAGATIALGALMALLAVMLKVSGQAQKALGPLIALSVCIGILAGVIYLISTIPTEKLIPSVAALSTLLIVMTGVLTACVFVGKFAGQALVGVLALTTMVIPLLAFIGVLALMQNITIATNNINALIGLVGVLTLMLIPLTIVGALAMTGTPFLGILALTAMAIPLLTFIGILALMQNIQNAEANVNLLTSLMKTLTTTMVVLAVVGPLALIGITAVTALTGLIGVFGILVTAVGALMNTFPGLEMFVNKGISLLEKLANGLGSVIGSFISGLGSGMASGLSKILEPLSEFFDGLVPIMEAMSNMSGADTSVVDSVKSLTEAILIITGANLLESLTSWVTGESSVSKFSEELSVLGDGLKGFADAVTGINPNEVNAAADAAKALAEMTKVIPTEGGVKGWLMGETSIAKFGNELIDLGKGLKGFADAVVGLDCESVKAASEAAKNLADMASTIPNEGGVAGWFAGENSIAKFANELIDLGKGLKGFSDSVVGINCESVKAASEAAKNLADMASTIPNEGGVVAWFTGENSMVKFAGELPKLGEGLKLFSDKLNGMDAENVSSAAKAAKGIAELVNTPLSGDASIITKIGSKMEEFAAQLKSFCNKLSEIKNLDAGVGKIEKAVYIAKSFTDLNNQNVGNIVTVGKNLEECAACLKSFSNKMSELKQDALNSAFTKIQTITTEIKNISSIDLQPLKSMGDALKNAGVEGVKAFVSAFTSETSKTDVSNAVNTMVTSAVSSAKSETNYNNFVSAGSYCLSGFVDGLTNVTGLASVTAAGTKIGNYAYEAAKKAIDAHSPSKKFSELGLFSILGFSKGIKDNLKTVDESGRSIGTEVLTAFQDEMEIHSPSVVMNKQGHYIVQGVAEGIKSDMSAEEAAAKKAQNIIDAFQKVFDKFDIDSKTAKNKFDLWKLTDGRGASPAEENREYTKYLEGQLERDKKANDAAYDKWQQMLANGFKADSQEAKEAFNEYVEASIKVGETTNELRERKLKEWDNNADLAQKAIDAETSEYETWLATEGRYTDKETLYEKLKDHLEFERLNLQDIENRAKWKLEWLKANKGTEEEIAAATEAYNTAVQNRAAKEDELYNLDYTRRFSDKYEQLDKNEEARDRKMRLWEAKNGDTASSAERLAMEETLATEEASDAVKEANLARKEYIQAMADAINGKGSAEKVEAARIKMEEAEIKVHETNSKMLNIKRDIVKNERDTARDIASLASEIAEHEYDVCEKTTGRKATDSEKDAKRLEIYARQMQSQRTIYDMALADVRTARETYGMESQEYRDAYRIALQEESTLVGLQDEILTTKENLEKRQKKHYNKQQLAMTEYKDYIKKYRQYYLEHGLTEADLERDAKAAANYDPTKTVESIVNKTSSALNSALSTSGAYSLGTSYVSSISTGISENVPTVLETTQGMLDSCTETLTQASSQWLEKGKLCVNGFINGIKERLPHVNTTVRTGVMGCVNVIKSTSVQWTEAGKQCVVGFANGLRNNASIAVAAAEFVASQAIEAAEATFEVNSPSKVFWETAKYCVEGLAGGFIDNTNISEGAAKSLAEDAVNSFTLAIQQITDSVDSKLDTQPTIRPVLDLSNVEKGAARLTSMFSTDRAVSISAMRNANANNTNQNEDNTTNSKGKTINYVQNNYSPKALSPTDIYRRTKNQLSAMKGVLE